jgi:hypothetical protein
MPGIGPKVGIGVNRNRTGSLSSYWTQQNVFDCLWWKSAPVDGKLKDISGNGNDIIITGCDFTTPYIPYTSSATFKMPEVTALKTDDTDGLWWKTDDSARGADKTSIAELVGYDFARTIIWYDDASPYHIRAIGLLKSSVSLTTAQKNKLRDSFRLSVWWDGTLSMYGYIKGNRAESQSVWVPESVVPAQFSDSNAVAWYDYTASATITKDGSNLVSKWADKNGSGRDLNVASGYVKPLAQVSGILFSSTGAGTKLEASFTLNQPEFIYAVIKQVSWGSGQTIWDGATRNTSLLFGSGTTPKVAVYAGGSLADTGGLVLGEYHIVRVLLNGASSKLQIDENTATTGNAGTSNMGGFTLGDRAAADSSWAANFEVKEILIRKVADDSTVQSTIYNYLKTKYGL